jgi:hypothetical protein
LTLSIQAAAGESSFGDRIYSLWSEVKTSVSQFLAQWTGDERKPASEEAPQQPAQNPAAAATTTAATPSDTTPYFVAPIKGSSRQEMHQASEAVKAQPLFKVTKAARAPVAKIPLDKAGVPVFALDKTVTHKVKRGKKTVTRREVVRVVKNIPLLDVGEEAKVSATDFSMPEININRVEYKRYAELKSPALWSKKDWKKNLGPKVKTAGDVIKIKTKEDTEGFGVVTLKKVQKVAYKLAEDAAVEIKPIKDMNEEDLKFIRGLMLYVAGDKCHYASGIFYDMLSSKKENLRDASRFYLGDCQYKMGLFTQSAENLFAVLESGVPAEMKAKAYTTLSSFPEDYNVQLGKRFEKYVGTVAGVSPEAKAGAAYMSAAAAMRRESFNTARKFAEMVPESHKYYVRAQFILAVSDYQLGKAKAGLDRLKKLQAILPHEPVHKDLHALISLNLARMAFQEKQYAEASKYYLAIEKNHPLWLTGLTEHAWTQLMAGDNEGAIGNMFSLQSTYLKAVYRPESYIVRTIGYLNLCQYADAYKSLTLLEREYRPWIPRIEGFMKHNPKSVDYYKTMVRYLTSSSSTEVGGLPYQALREIGRHKDFLNLQEAINLKIDEGEQYKFIDRVAAKDFEKSKALRGQAARRLRAIEADLRLIAKGKKVPKEENQLKMNRANERHLVDFYDFQLGVFKEAGVGYRKMRNTGRRALTSERERLAVRAGEVLKKRLAQIRKDLLKYFENNEFLRYEVFAGSGENIRFHMAGGESAGEKRIPSSVKPESKDLNWDFQGEFWEDEIGHYKSTLKDNCPQRAAVK